MRATRDVPRMTRSKRQKQDLINEILEKTLSQFVTTDGSSEDDEDSAKAHPPPTPHPLIDSSSSAPSEKTPADAVQTGPSRSAAASSESTRTRKKADKAPDADEARHVEMTAPDSQPQRDAPSSVAPGAAARARAGPAIADEHSVAATANAADDMSARMAEVERRREAREAMAPSMRKRSEAARRTQESDRENEFSEAEGAGTMEVDEEMERNAATLDEAMEVLQHIAISGVPADVAANIMGAINVVNRCVRTLTRKIDYQRGQLSQRSQRRRRQQRQPDRQDHGETTDASVALPEGFPPLSKRAKRPMIAAASRKPQPRKPQPVPVPPKTWAVVVSGEGLTSEKVKEVVLRDVASTLKDVRVQAVRRTRDGGVTLETNSANDMAAIRASDAFASKGLVLSAPPPRRVKLIVLRVPSQISDSVLMEELTVRNRDPDAEQAEFAKGVRLISRGGKGADAGNAILEVTPGVSAFWKAQGGVDVLWQLHRVRELSGVELCFRCFGHGHGAAKCDQPAPLCMRCGEAGHLVRNCRAAESCRNCRMAGKPDGHAVNSATCPLYGRALERIKLRQSYCQE